MEPIRAITAVLLAVTLTGCSSEGGPAGPAEAPSVPPLYSLAASDRVSVDTIDRDSYPGLGRGVSDAGGIPVTGDGGGGVWSETGVTFLPGSSGAAAITASGEVLGQSASGITIWGPAGPRIVGEGNPYALNDLATVLIGSSPEPARWDDGVMSPLQHPGEGIGGVFPLGVNNSGTIVGTGIMTALDSRAIRWDGTVPSFLAELAPGGAHGALAIDNAGRIVGYSTGTVDGVTGRFPVVWEGGAPRPLPRAGAETPFGNAQDIDDAGNIVGWLRMENGEDHAMLWTAEGELIDLGASLPGLQSYARGVGGGVVSGVAFRPGQNPDLDRPILVRWTVRPATRYTFDGFYAPVANAPTVNRVKTGKGVPVRFSLGADFGLQVFEPGYPEERAIACDTAAPIHEVNETVNAKSSGLTFDSVSGQYTYVWKTERASVGSCRDLVLRLDDGQERVIRFQLTR